MIVRTSNYPYSPRSESDLASTNTSPEIKTLHITMADEENVPPNLINTKFNRVQGAVRRARSPPRNEHNQMYCDHVNCDGKNQTFKRVCEWNKHMDRHERPYKCREAGCELNPGFTYSGGLLRHQREVHKMHLSTKMPLFCPFENCNRSSGTGFTRKENLEEHKRRRHLEEMSDHAASSNRGSSQPPAPTQASTHSHQQHQRQATQEPVYKRRRIAAETDTNDTLQQYRLEPNNTIPLSSSTLVATTVSMDDRPRSPGGNLVTVLSHQEELVRHLQAELRRKDEVIVQHVTELHRLQSILRNLPPQTVYSVGVMHSRQRGGGVG
ncbi:hypothetical protein LTR84_002096 [Exophiala bonariae]|uniref:C2H2-type domain-containing protein n=1 Tax=Exophiala bonariae TaxID=1690606 RepID=A0AAV9NCM1_9EURO|nr:hypothetical protein LTR84_002096 [Exophiala bonariae]